MEEICAISAVDDGDDNDDDDGDDDDDDDAKLYLSRDTKSELGHTFSITGNVCSIAKMPTKGEKKKEENESNRAIQEQDEKLFRLPFFPIKKLSDWIMENIILQEWPLNFNKMLTFCTAKHILDDLTTTCLLIRDRQKYGFLKTGGSEWLIVVT